MLDSVVETFLALQCTQKELNQEYEGIIDYIVQTVSVTSPDDHRQKRRKAHSLESPSVTAPVNISDRNKSDTDVSSSVLNQNINLPPDTEESFFVQSQSSPLREPLSPKAPAGDENGVNSGTKKTPSRRTGWFKPAIDEVAPEAADRKKSKKSILSRRRFSSSFHLTSEPPARPEDMLPVRPKLSTPRGTASAFTADQQHQQQQENMLPPGKWTSTKKATASTVWQGKTPTGEEKKTSLLNRTRMRQTKLRFPDNTHNRSFADDEEAFFDDFVIPSPTSLSGSRFMKSVARKEQSSRIGEAKSNEATKKSVNSPTDDDFDIDQTYFSEAEKLVHPKNGGVKIKQERLSTTKKVFGAPTRPEVGLILAKESQHQQSEDPGENSSSSVEILKPPSQEEVITIEETQPSKRDLFLEAIREQAAKEAPSRGTILELMAVPPITAITAKPRRVTSTQLRRCTNCTKHYRMLELRGMDQAAITSKLPRNCRECKIAQLHETPPGFWNPEFSPTQRD